MRQAILLNPSSCTPPTNWKNINRWTKSRIILNVVGVEIAYFESNFLMSVLKIYIRRHKSEPIFISESIWE